MRQLYILTTTLFLFGSLFFVACKQDKKLDQEMLIGRWEIIEGERNGQVSEMLADLYFEFFRDGNMRSNLPGADGLSKFELKEGQIFQTGENLQPVYLIQELTDSTLLMSSQISNYDFRFLLGKKVTEH